MKKIQFTNEELKHIIQLYTQDHLSMAAIGKQYNVSKTVIKRVLIENDCQIARDNHKYFANYDIFHTIDTPEKAYWLGFIAADGCVYQRPADKKGGGFVRIALSSHDKGHLEKFKKFMNSNVNIQDFISTTGFSNNTPESVIVFNSNQMVNDLIDKGIVPKKSLILKPPKIDEEFYLPYLLGLFDGDGTISHLANGNYSIGFIGTKENMEWIKQILNWDTKLERRRDDNKNTYYIRCGGTKKPYEIIKKLYDSCPTVHLDRKYELFKELETVVLSRNR